MAIPWVVRLRYGIVAGEAAIIGVAYAFRLDFPFPWTLAPLAAGLGSNVLLHRSPKLAERLPEMTLGAVFVLDTLCLSAMLGLTGGPMNPFSLLYLVQITLSAVALPKVWTWALAGLSAASFGLLFYLHVPSTAFLLHHDRQGLSPHLVGMWIAFMVAAGLIAFFAGKISDDLRERERQVLRLQERIAKSERLASLGTLAAGAAHELGTPLGTIAVASRELELGASRLADGEAVREDAALIRDQVERCHLILQRMSADGAEPMGETARSVTVGRLFELALDRFSESQRVSVARELPRGDQMVKLPVQVTVQSLAALLKNGFDACTGQPELRLRAERRDAKVRFEIHDRGCGMTDAVLRRISEPFFTTKDPGAGMGLGTFLVRTFAERLGGSLSYDSTPGEGTVAILELPADATMETPGVHAAA
ncbi:MAG: HAMP domain-containing histidine kinase [Acidobacteria bacterium]|nr:HAMP domain-containing histidine kinase [Acidobacteriota bacterium]